MKQKLKSKSVKNNSLNNYFNMKTATKTFKKLLERRNQENRLKKQKLQNITENFFIRVNNAFFKEEIKENDLDYVHREIKYLQKYRQALIDLYGKDAQKRILENFTEPFKYDKKILFNPFNDYKEKDEYKYRYNIFNKNDKKMNLPLIFNNTSKNINMIKLIKKNNSEENKSFNQSNITNKNSINNNISTYNSLITESSTKYQKHNLTFNKYAKNNNKNKSNFFTITNNGLNSNNRSKMSLSTEGNLSNKLFNKEEYLMTLDNLLDESKDNQKKHKNYFKSFDNKSNVYRNKFNYISKLLFK